MNNLNHPTITKKSSNLDSHGETWTLFVPHSYIVECEDDPRLAMAIWLLRLAFQAGKR